MIGIHSFRFTYEGIDKYMELFQEGYNSNRCFIAMAFQEETKPIREAIKNAIKQTGFEPVIVDERDNPSDKTIVDEIISNLRKCKFCIADFSFHKNGVYFESGFAVGQGKPVIYTCEKKHFADAHFDIKSLQQIIYETPEEVERMLVNKIEAWIK